MPANRGVGGPHWNPRPDFVPHIELQAANEPLRPQSFEEAVGHVLTSGLREITDYEGYPDLQRTTAEDIAQQAYESELAFDIAIATYSEQNVSHANTQADPLQEDIYLRAVLMGMQRRRAKDDVNNHLATIVMLRQDLKTGETSLESHYVQRKRSFA
jgi:hypothetical protein